MKNFIFDLGAVLLHWHPQTIARNFTPDPALQARLLREVFNHSDWTDMDRGTLSEEDLIARAGRRLALPRERLEALLSQIRESLLPIEATEALLYRAGAAGKQLYCLSNMSVETYNYIKARLAFFTRFQGIVISAQEKMAKPDPAIFSLLLERFALLAGETVFIDDSPANVAAARGLGIHAIHFDGSDACYERIGALLR